ncbi:CGNR zinc finger domain-containing protein [Streptomyces melanosporofaciens]|uniref:CGNR zinc finger domain-containing protein n=1 Tax=Streptomyces melanosporofaciens TaxID=67327 RepID=UPI003CC79EB6
MCPPDCQWVHYDNSRPGRARWCSPQLCGNRTKTQAYRPADRAEPSRCHAAPVCRGGATRVRWIRARDPDPRRSREGAEGAVPRGRLRVWTCCTCAISWPSRKNSTSPGRRAGSIWRPPH